jgi:Flp pilus assembly protein TadG
VGPAFGRARLTRGEARARGAAAVEAAFALPVLVLILIGAADFGRAFYLTLAVQHAAAVGAEYGAQSIIQAQNTAGMQTAAASAATDINGFTATAVAAGTPGSNPCMCFDGTTETAMVSCAAPCAGSVRVYARVDGSATFTTIAPYPGIPRPLVVSRTVWRRAQ